MDILQSTLPYAFTAILIIIVSAMFVWILHGVLKHLGSGIAYIFITIVLVLMAVALLNN